MLTEEFLRHLAFKGELIVLSARKVVWCSFEHKTPSVFGVLSMRATFTAGVGGGVHIVMVWLSVFHKPNWLLC